MENAFRDGEIKTAGTDIDKIMPPISRFGGGGRAKKKLGVIEKLRAFFEKVFRYWRFIELYRINDLKVRHGDFKEFPCYFYLMVDKISR